jgi:uncharacterized cofD-like protein
MDNETLHEERLRHKRVVVMGGGTGTFTVLSGIRTFPVHISAVVSIADNGGSTGVLRDELGVLPPGDIRQCLVALAEEGSIWRRLFSHRVEREGSLKGHTGGNLMIALLEDMTSDPLEAINAAHALLRCKGQVIPVSTTATHLVAELEDGTRVFGEHDVDEPTRGQRRAPIRRCLLEPSVKANPAAIEAILRADLLVLGPGDLYTSLYPVLLVEGIREALAQTKAKIAYVVNLMSKRGQTDGFTGSTFVERVSAMIAPAKLAGVIMNQAPIPTPILELYDRDGEHPIRVDDLDGWSSRLTLVRADLLSKKIRSSTPGDTVKRSVLRHDSDALAQAVLSLLA